MNIEITIGGPLADAINALAAALQTSNVIERAQAASQPKTPRKSKQAQPEVAENTGSNGSDQAPPSMVATPEAAVPYAAPQETVAAVTEGEAVAPSITTYEELRTFVAPLLANPDTKTAVAKAVKKYCGGKLQDIKSEDYPALVAALKELVK